MAHEGNHICLHRFSFIYAVNDLWEDAYTCPIYAVNRTTESANLRYGMSAYIGFCCSYSGLTDFIDTIPRLLYTKPTSKSQTNNSYDYETFVIVIILTTFLSADSKPDIWSRVWSQNSVPVRQEIPFWWTIQCREHLISKKPMQIDVLVKNEKHVKLKKNIRRIFRQYNIIEYKSPEDGSGTGRQRHILPHRGCHPNTACHSPKAVKGA